MTFKRKLRKIYRAFFYPFFKNLEKNFRTILFILFKWMVPKFNAFRFFGIPYGIKSIDGEEVISPGSEVRTLPKTPDDQILSRFTPLQIATPGGSIAILKNGFSTAAAASLTDKGYLVPQFTEQFTMSRLDRHKLFTFRMNRCFASIPHFDGMVASLTVDGQWNYYHWLFDALPKLYLMKKKGLIPDLYYADMSKPFHRESFHFLGIADKQIICPNKHPFISASSLIVASFPCLQGVPKWVCDFLKSTFIKDPMHSHVNSPRRIFISRRDASYRRILNEGELYPLLQQEGFVIVQPEHLSFSEQISLFHSAEVVLAPHGAGLANLVFCKPHTKVIEMFPPRFLCTCYWTLSNLIGAEYFSLSGRDDPLTYSPVCEGYDHMIVDAQKLKKVLEWI